MINHRSRRPTVLNIVAAAAVMGLSLAGCGNTDQESPAEPTQSTTPTVEAVLGEGSFPTVESVDRANANDVAATTARLAHSWDTEFDTTQTDGLERAKPLMSDQFAETIEVPTRNAAQAEWVTAAQTQAYSAPQVRPAASDGTAQDFGPNRAAFSYQVSWDWIGRDGSTTDGEGLRNVEVYVERDSADDEWAVVGYVARSTT